MKKLFVIVFLFWCFLSQAQDPFYLHHTIDNGLPSNTVYDVYQDPGGYIWLSTDVGAVKYDSKTFQIYNTDAGLSDNEVFKLKEDSKGRKWPLTLNGIISFIQNDTVYNESNSIFLQPTENRSMLVDFYESAEGWVYLLTLDGNMNIIDGEDELSRVFLNYERVYGLWQRDSKVFAITNEGILDIAQNVLVEKFEDTQHCRVYHVGSETYFSRKGALYRITENNTSSAVLSLPTGNDIINIFFEDEANLWICTRKGLLKFENDVLKANYFDGISVSCITKDHEQNYWVSTLNNGLFFIPSFNILQRKTRINCISINDRDEVWFGGTQNDYYVKKGDQFIARSLNSSWRKDDITNIKFFGEDTYVGSKSGLLKISASQEFEMENYTPNDLLVKDVEVFIASSVTRKLERQRFDRAEVLEKSSGTLLLQQRTHVLSQGVDDDIWLGTNIGLFKYTQEDSVQYFGTKNKKLETSITDLFFDQNSELLLVSSNSKGLIILDGDDVAIDISQKDGLPNNTINTLEKIDKDTYLIGTNKGISSLTLSGGTFEISNLNTPIGLNTQRIKDLAYVRDTVYIATEEELIFFNYNHLKDIQAKPLCSIKTVRAGNEAISLDGSQAIEFDKNSIKINYAGISFIDHGEVTYFYKLNGEESDWSSTRETQVHYNSLRPGKHEFSVYCVNGFNKESEIQRVFFTIKKPFWLKTWFIVGLVIFMASLIFFIWKLRLSYINRSFEKERKALLLEKENVVLENQMLALEQKALRLQMNPHFIFNALNTIKGYYSEGNIREASNYISKFSKLLRLLLEHVDQYIPLSLEIEMLELYLELTKVRYENKFDYKITVNDEINVFELNIPTLLLQPIVENAIIHGVAPKHEKGHIGIDFNIQDDNLVSTVIDNGIGRMAAQKRKRLQHQSMALQITRERLDLIEFQENKRCSLLIFDLHEGDQPTGTKVELKIPLILNW